MATPMESKLKLLCDSSIKSVDSTMYQKMIGSLMSLMNTRLYICFSLNILSQLLTDLSYVDLIATKHVLRYLKSIVKYRLIVMFSAIDRNSTSRYCFNLGSGMISWFSRNQSCMAHSTPKAEYVTTCSTSCEAVRFHKLLIDFLISN